MATDPIAATEDVDPLLQKVGGLRHDQAQVRRGIEGKRRFKIVDAQQPRFGDGEDCARGTDDLKRRCVENDSRGRSERAGMLPGGS